MTRGKEKRQTEHQVRYRYATERANNLRRKVSGNFAPR